MTEINSRNIWKHPCLFGYIQQGRKITGAQVVRDEKVRCYERENCRPRKKLVQENAASTDHNPEFANVARPVQVSGDKKILRGWPSIPIKCNQKHGINSSDSKKQHNNDERGIHDHVQKRTNSI